MQFQSKIFNYSGYNEELKKVGVCKKCSKKEISFEPPRKKVQKSIYSMFQKQTVSQKPNNIVLSKPKQSPSSSVSASSWKTTPTTIEKWKLELVKDAVDKWPVSKLTAMVRPKISSVTSVSCMRKISLLPSYSDAFVVGSKNYKKLTI